MNLAPIWDPVFLLPWLAGLPLVLALALLGTLLRLRDEWLAALGLAHLATASGLAGAAVGMPPPLAAPVGALLGAGLKYLTGKGQNSAYGVMILAGWSTTLLLAANTALGDALAHAVVDGQLYFAGRLEVGLAWLAGGLVLVLLPVLMPHLLRARFFPDHELANRLPIWRWHLVFDLLVAGVIAVATMTLGLMAAFAFIFLPAMMAFSGARSWRGTLIASGIIGGLAYLASFVLALALDQPFGPLAVALLLIGLGLARLRPRLNASGAW